MIEIILSLIFAKFGIILIVGLALAAAVFTMAFASSLGIKLPGWVPLACGLLALVHLYSGWIYQTGVAAEHDRVVKAEKAEQQRQAEASAKAIADLQAKLTQAWAGEAAANAAADELQKAIASRPAVAGRAATKEDVDALNR